MIKTMHVGSGNRVYTSPLAEEFHVSFEDNFLGTTGEPASLNSRTVGSNGSAGNEDLSGDTYSF